MTRRTQDRRSSMGLAPPHKPVLGAFWIAASYFALALLWILLSDEALKWLEPEVDRQQQLQTYKGVFFISITAILLFLLVRRELGRQQAGYGLVNSLLDSYETPVLAKDRDGRYIMANAAACRATGLSVDQIVGRTVEEVFDAAYARVVREMDERVMKFGISESHERTGAFGGFERTLLICRSPIRDAAGRIIGVVAVTQDITARKSVEAAVRLSEQRFRALVENAFDAICLVDREGRITYASPGATRISGWAGEELVGRAALDLVHEADKHMVGANLHMVFESRHDGRRVEFRLKHRDGSVRWIETTGRNLLADPHIKAIVINWRDVTERRRADEASRKHNVFREAIINTAAEGICASYRVPEFPFSRFTIWNRRMAELTGYSMDEINAIGWHEAMFPDPGDRRKVIDRAQRVREGHPMLGEEWVITTRSGAKRIIAVSSSLITAEDGQAVVVGVMLDVTDRHRHEEELRRAYETERLLFRELDHRVRNNLASLVSLIEITRRTTRDPDAFASSIGGRVGTMAGIHALLSRAQWKPVEISALIQAVLPAMPPGRIRLDGPPVAVPLRQTTALSMVLHELATNSAKYGALSSPAGCIMITWRPMAISAAGRTIELTWVEEGGPSVPPKPTPGTGSGLIEGLCRAELRGRAELRYPPEGVSHKLTLLLDAESRLLADGSVAIADRAGIASEIIGAEPIPQGSS